jgi:hypothetical protein
VNRTAFAGQPVPESPCATIIAPFVTEGNRAASGSGRASPEETRAAETMNPSPENHPGWRAAAARDSASRPPVAWNSRPARRAIPPRGVWRHVPPGCRCARVPARGLPRDARLPSTPASLPAPARGAGRGPARGGAAAGGRSSSAPLRLSRVVEEGGGVFDFDLHRWEPPPAAAAVSRTGVRPTPAIRPGHLDPLQRGLAAPFTAESFLRREPLSKVRRSLDPCKQKVERLIVRFLTPTGLKAGSAMVSRPEFGILLAGIRDLVSTLPTLRGAPWTGRPRGGCQVGARRAHSQINYTIPNIRTNAAL